MGADVQEVVKPFVENEEDVMEVDLARYIIPL